MALTLSIDLKNTIPSSVDARSRVAGTASGTLLVAKYGTSTLYRSVNGGTSWTTETFPLSFCDVLVWNGSYFLGAYNGSWCKSTTGAPGSWTTGSFATVRANQCLVWNGALWMLGRLFGGGSSWAEMAYSSDGTSWSYSALTTTDDAYELLWDSAKWCVMGSQEASPFNMYFWSSPTGATWTQGGQVDAAVGFVQDGFVYTGSVYVASAGGGGGGTVGYSSTGATWSASAESGKVLFAAASNALIHDGSGTTWKISTNGSSWTPITPVITGSGSFAPRRCTPGQDTKFYAVDGTVLGIMSLATVVPPFWTNFIGSREEI